MIKVLLLLAEPHTISTSVLPRLAGLASFPVPQGSGSPRKQLYFLATKAVGPEEGWQLCSPRVRPWDAGTCLGSCGGNRTRCPAAAATAGVLLPQQVLRSEL